MSSKVTTNQPSRQVEGDHGPHAASTLLTYLLTYYLLTTCLPTRRVPPIANDPGYAPSSRRRPSDLPGRRSRIVRATSSMNRATPLTRSSSPTATSTATTYYLLLAADYSLLTTHYSLLTTHDSRLTTHSLLLLGIPRQQRLHRERLPRRGRPPAAGAPLPASRLALT